MKVDVEELGACKRRLQVEETPEVVQEAWARAFTRVQREAKLPGFRKGKVPRSMVKLHFSNDVRQEVARHLIPEVYRQALAETQLKPVEEPDLQEVTLEESSPLKFSAVVEIKPTIALGQEPSRVILTLVLLEGLSVPVQLVEHSQVGLALDGVGGVDDGPRLAALDGGDEVLHELIEAARAVLGKSEAHN